jgi:hypothetical protein
MKSREHLLRSMTLGKSTIIAFDLETTGTNTSTDQKVEKNFMKYMECARVSIPQFTYDYFLQDEQEVWTT